MVASDKTGPRFGGPVDPEALERECFHTSPRPQETLRGLFYQMNNVSFSCIFFFVKVEFQKKILFLIAFHYKYKTEFENEVRNEKSIFFNLT